MPRILGVCLLAGLLTACASHRPVKVTCSSHLVRINALVPPAHVEAPPAAPPAPAEGSPTPPPAEEDAPQ
jgi:hypothetical protein